MAQQRSGRDEDVAGVTDTGDGTGGTFGTGTAGGGPISGVSDTGDGTGGSLGTGTTGDRGAGAAAPSKGGRGRGASDKMIKGMSEAGKHPEAPLNK